MRILIYSHEFPPLGGGAGEITYQIGRMMAKYGHKVYILTGRYSHLPKYEEKEGMKIYRVTHPHGAVPGQFPKLWGFLMFIPFSFFKLIWLILSKKIDLINAQFAFPAGFPAVIAAKLTFTPCVVSFIGGDVYDPSRPAMSWQRKFVIRFVSALATKLTANNTELESRVRAFQVKKPIEIIHYGVDSKFRVDKTKRDPNMVKVLSLSRLVPRKGLPTFIEALGLLSKKARFPFKVTIASEGPLKESLKKKVKELGLEKKVVFPGFIEDSQKAGLCQSHNIFVLPSLHEGLPIVSLEAMASGMAIVATNVGGIPDEVTDNGILVPKENPKALAEALLKLINNYELREEMGNKSRERIDKIFNWEKVGRQYEKLFKSATRK